MAEIIGVAASAVTLAALFSRCIECFSYFKAAQNCPTEAESLLVKLDCEKARLLVWANTVGILQTDPRKRHSKLADVKHEGLVRRCVDQIIALLTDARKLQDEYGGRATSEQEIQRYLAVVSVNSMSVFQSTKRTFFARAGTQVAMPSFFSRMKWAIRDAAKFRILILDLREFVDHLIQLISVPPETISSIVEEDIVSTVDIGSLRLIEDGCDEGSYPQWSARASEAIRDSEMGTVDRRNLVEILGDTGSMQEVKTTSLQSEATSEARYSAVSFHNTFVVLTATCLNFQAEGDSPCDESNIYKAVCNRRNSTSFTTSGLWSLGRRLCNHLTQPYDWADKLEQHKLMSIEHARINFELPDMEKLCILHVYCGACTCAINTARMLATSKDLPEYVDVVIRIDDRLTTSCRDSDSRISVLEAIRDAIEDCESKVASDASELRTIDCPALERRIYVLEQEQYELAKPETMLQQFVLEEFPHLQKGLPSAGIVIIAENDIIGKSLHHAPINSQPRRPRAGELYKFAQGKGGAGSGYDMEFLGRLSKSKAWKDRDKARKDATNSSDDNAPNAIASRKRLKVGTYN